MNRIKANHLLNVMYNNVSRCLCFSYILGHMEVNLRKRRMHLPCRIFLHVAG
jgi:hypothetical protein